MGLFAGQPTAITAYSNTVGTKYTIMLIGTLFILTAYTVRKCTPYTVGLYDTAFT
jgi:hypothetical protein